jgi:hypothetical protein
VVKLDRPFPALLCALFALAAPVRAQPVLQGSQELAFDRPESWAMKYFASVTLLTGLGAPRPAKPGSIELGIEIASVPTLSAEERTVGFGGTKTEDLNRTSVFGRPRVRIGLPHELALTLSYVPPVELFDTEPHLAALAVERPFHMGRRWRLGARSTSTPTRVAPRVRSWSTLGASRRAMPGAIG